MGNHEFHDRQSPGDEDTGDTERLPDPTQETAAPASLAGFAEPMEYPSRFPDVLPWSDDGRVDPPVTVTGTLDPDTGEISDLAVAGRPADLADVNASEQAASCGQGERPGSLLGVDGFGAPAPDMHDAAAAASMTVPFAPADPQAAAQMTGLPVETFSTGGGRDVTHVHDPGDPEQYAGPETDDGFDDDPIERAAAGGED